MKNTFWLFCVLLSLFSCQSTDVVFEKNNEIAGAQWSYEDVKTFQFSMQEIEEKYRLIIFIRHTKEFVNENIWLKIGTKFPDGKIIEDEVELSLAEKSGGWLGDGLGSIITRELILQDNFSFTKAGDYEIFIEQFMRVNPVEEVLDIGLRLEKMPQNP